MTVLAAAAGATTVWLIVVPRLPVPDGDHPDLYRTITTRRRSAWAVLPAATAAVTVLLAAVSAPGWALPLLTVYAALCAPLALIDGLTHRLPARLCHAGWILLPATGVAGAAATGEWNELVQCAAAAAVTLAVFGIPWLFRTSIGFGDVRYAPLAGAAAGTLGFTSCAVALLTAAALSLTAHAIVRLARGAARPNMLPWGPPLYLGVIATLTIAATTR